MSWAIAREPKKCTSLDCHDVIGTGQPYREMTVAKWAVCAPCAKRRLGEQPPDDLHAEVPVLERFRTARVLPMPKAIEALPADFKIAQYERDGED